MIIKKVIIFLILIILNIVPQSVCADIGSLKQYPFNRVNLTENASENILILLKACADIMDYDCNDYDINKLTKYVLYTRNNFKVLGCAPEFESQNTPGTPLRFCDSKFVENVLYSAFRLEPEQPHADKLLEYSYYYSDGLYYYSGGFDTYFATDILGISEVYQLDDSTYYVIFPNTYVEGDAPLQFEYSSAIVGYDRDGFYIKRINMNSEPLSSEELHSYSDRTFSALYEFTSAFKKYVPAVVLTAGLSLIIFIAFKYLI